MPHAFADPVGFISLELPSPLERNSAQIAADNLHWGETASSSLNLILHDSSQWLRPPGSEATAHLTDYDHLSVIWLIGCCTSGAVKVLSRAFAERDKPKHDPSMYSTVCVGRSYGTVLHSGASYCFGGIILTH